MNEMSDRRAFLHQALTVAAATALHKLSHAKESKAAMLPIIDTHQHLWDLKKFRLPWIKEGAPLAKSYLPSDYAAATAGLNIVKAVYMEVDLDPAQQVEEADYLIDLCKRKASATVAGVISGRPNSDGFKDYITRYRNNPYIKGVRQVLHVPSTPAGYCLDPKFIRGIRLLGELGMSFDLVFRHPELGDAVKLIDACPDTRFILDHCGNGDVQSKDRTQWQKDMAAIGKRKNVVGKVSGFIVTAKPYAWTPDELAPIVNHTLEVFGPDRVMFGGDWPVCTLAATYKQWFEALQTIVKNRPEDQQRKLFHDNAARFYGIA